MLGELLDKLLEYKGCLRDVVTCFLSCQLGCWASCHNPVVVPSGNPSGDLSRDPLGNWLGELPGKAGGRSTRLAQLSVAWDRLQVKRRVGIVLCRLFP